jgi:peptide chain release factor 2
LPRRSPICRHGRPSYGGIFDYEAKQSRLAALNRELEDPKLWDNPQRAQELGKEKKALEAVVATLGRVGSGLSDAQ